MEKQTLVYEVDWLINRIYEESDKLLSRITSTERFEERCIKDIGEYLYLDKGNAKNKSHLIRLINRKVKEALESFKKEEHAYFSDVVEGEIFEDEIEFEPEDTLASVEGEVVTKEMTALLAQDDQKVRLILDYWMIGNTNNAHISRSLARTFGGNEKSHRVSIYRFRESCREQLSTAI